MIDRAPGFLIEPLRVVDVPAVRRLEAAAGLSSLGPDGYQDKLAEPGSVMLVARAGETILGAFSSWVVVDELQIDNLVVRPDARRLGVGRALLTAGLRTAAEKGAVTACLEVRAGNWPALALYTRCGFVVAGRRPNYYRAPPDDALILVCRGEKYLTEGGRKGRIDGLTPA